MHFSLLAESGHAANPQLAGAASLQIDYIAVQHLRTTYIWLNYMQK
jgi:hypothetical protein